MLPRFFLYYYVCHFLCSFFRHILWVLSFVLQHLSLRLSLIIWLHLRRTHPFITIKDPTCISLLLSSLLSYLQAVSWVNMAELLIWGVEWMPSKIRAIPAATQQKPAWREARPCRTARTAPVPAWWCLPRAHPAPCPQPAASPCTSSKSPTRTAPWSTRPQASMSPSATWCNGTSTPRTTPSCKPPSAIPARPSATSCPTWRPFSQATCRWRRRIRRCRRWRWWLRMRCRFGIIVARANIVRRAWWGLSTRELLILFLSTERCDWLTLCDTDLKPAPAKPSKHSPRKPCPHHRARSLAWWTEIPPPPPTAPQAAARVQLGASHQRALQLHPPAASQEQRTTSSRWESLRSLVCLLLAWCKRTDGLLLRGLQDVLPLWEDLRREPICLLGLP